MATQNHPSSSFYLTTAIPYVNAKPHLGHVFEWMQADVIARYQRALGKDVAFTAGADENSLKNVQAAEKAGVDTQAWLDEYSQVFQDAFAFFGISLTHFRRGSDQKLHWPGVQELWNRCVAAGDVYTKTYEGLYCVGCESFYTPDELIDGKCPEHLTVPEKVKEENYFFRLSKYQDQILQLIESNELRLVSHQYRQEMLGFIKHGLEDFSISRSVERGRGIGVPVPNDPKQVMYVWFDALSIYMTAVGWGFDQKTWEQFWPADVHVIGKGIARFHAVYWIGMLLSAGLPLPKCISIHGYITAGGQKMSKSLGNVIDPFQMVEKYGLEPVRYYLLRAIPAHSDGDFTEERFAEVYTADLANGLGNLCSRTARLASQLALPGVKDTPTFDPEFSQLLNDVELDRALKWIWDKVTALDGYLSEQKPWQQEGDAKKATLEKTVAEIVVIATHLQPFLPQTATKILAQFQADTIEPLQPLFPRLPKSA